MLKYDLHVTHVPDHKAQVVLARIIVSSNNMVSMQQAVAMAANPPLLLFHNLERKVLEQHVEQLNSLGVEFDISEIQEVLDDSDVKFNAHREMSEPEPEPSAPPPTPPPKTQPERSAHSTQTPKRAVGHGHIKRQSGSRLSALRDAEKASRKRNIMFAAVSVAGILLIGILVANSHKGDKSTAESVPELVKADVKQEKKSAKSGKNAGKNAAMVSDSTAQPDDEPRVEATAQQKQQASAFVDSARADNSDMRKNVAFYKMAISFNRQNLAAWQGLLQAYRELRMDDAARDTERQMKAIFGEETFSVVNIVKSHGELVDAYVNGNGVHTVEYKTTKTSKVDILREIFGMTRAVRAACDCQNIFIHAATGSGKGVTAYSTERTSIHTLSEFMRQAEIVWLDE